MDMSGTAWLNSLTTAMNASMSLVQTNLSISHPQQEHQNLSITLISLMYKAMNYSPQHDFIVKRKKLKSRTYLSRLRSTLSLRRQQSFSRLSPVRRTEYEGKMSSEESGGLPTLSQGWQGRRCAAKMSISCRSRAMQSNRHTWSSNGEKTDQVVLTYFKDDFFIRVCSGERKELHNW